LSSPNSNLMATLRKLQIPRSFSPRERGFERLGLTMEVG
jgi:hypothetical protein